MHSSRERDGKASLEKPKSSSSALRTLKDTLKFKNSSKSSSKLPKSSSNNELTLANEKIRNNKNQVKRNVKENKQRMSAQRVSLFKYDNVEVMNCFVPVAATRQPSSSESTHSSNSTLRNRDTDTQSEHSLKSSTTIKIKPTSLMAKGPLEIYQILTPLSLIHI